MAAGQKTDRDDLIDMIVREVVYQIEQDGMRGDPGTEPAAEGTAVLITTHVPGAGRAVDAIKSVFGDSVEYIGFGRNCLPEGIGGGSISAEDEGYEAILDIVGRKKHIVMLAPTLAQLDDIANLRDGGFDTYIMTRSLLWGKDVSVLLDFEPPKSRHNTIYERTADMIEALAKAGIRILTYCPVPGSETELLSLVTERDIREAHKAGLKEVRKAAGAIVTPAAKDASRWLGVRIN